MHGVGQRPAGTRPYSRLTTVMQLTEDDKRPASMDAKPDVNSGDWTEDVIQRRGGHTRGYRT